MRILDPRFRYIPAVATDVSQTWRRFGFSAQANEARRAQRRSRDPVPSPVFFHGTPAASQAGE